MESVRTRMSREPVTSTGLVQKPIRRRKPRIASAQGRISTKMWAL
jgi:hypothetical protein